MDDRDRELLPLIRQLIAGEADPAGFETLYRHYLSRVHGYFRTRGFPPDQCHDLSHEVFLKVFRKLGNLREPERFEPWLFKIALRIAINVRRSKSEEAAVPIEDFFDDELDGLVRQPDDRPDIRLVQDEIRQLIRQAVTSLPLKMRQCMQLRVDGDLSYEEIALLTGVSLQTVRSQLFEGRQRIKKHLEQRNFRS